MFKSLNARLLLLSLAIATPLALGAVTVVSLPSGSANAHSVEPSARIDAAFALISMPGAADCAAATWPNIAATCLVRADGTPAPDVRVVRIAY